MTILDSIREAEAKADQMREDARAKVRDDMRAARKQAEDAHEQALSATRKSCNEALEKEQDKAETYLRSRIRAEAENDDRMVERGRRHLDDAVQFILERVKDS